MNFFWKKIIERLTLKVCQCNHTKTEHRIYTDNLDQMRKYDQHCMGWIFEGKTGGGGTLHCCQCLYYTQKKVNILRWIRLLLDPFIKKSDKDLEAYLNETLDNHFCKCGHSARQHDIGECRLDVLYPPCNVFHCECKAYYYDARITVETKGNVE